MAAKDVYSATGKEVLLNGAHYADANGPEDAIAIAYAMNNVYLAKLGPQSRSAYYGEDEWKRRT